MEDIGIGPMTDEPLANESKTKGALCYVPIIGWIISIFFILTEREDHYVRFNAIQSLLLHLFFVTAYILILVLSGILVEIVYAARAIGLFKTLLAPVYMLISILLIYKGYSGERFILPRLGVTAEKHM
jgi:uncharacterized membrane protein